MGSLLMAQCDCGFKSGIIQAGGGMMNFNEVGVTHLMSKIKHYGRDD